jgi:microcystin degradation protein MlrC
VARNIQPECLGPKEQSVIHTTPRTTPRIALAAFAVECNRFAPALTQADFEADTWAFGAEWGAQLRPRPPAGELAGFIAAMDAAGPWTLLPLGAAIAHPNGPVPDALFDGLQQRLVDGLRAAMANGGVDGIALMLHGAAVTPADVDPEGRLVLAMRQVVGPGVPIIAVLDLHANVSPRLLRQCDALVPYRSNPHVDQAACGVEAAALLQRLLAGQRWVRVLLRLPLLTPTICMRTASGSGPFADMVAAAAGVQQQPGVLLAAVLGGFPHSDTPFIGPAVLVQADNAQLAVQHARAVAAIGWRERQRLDPPLLGSSEAVARIAGCVRGPSPRRWALADLGDNPGGGAAACDVMLLQALMQAGVPGQGGLLAGLLHAPERVREAQGVGVGGCMPVAGLHARSRVVALSDGRCTGRRGLLAGARIHLGPCAALAFDGVTLVLSSIRFSPNDPACFEHLGLSIAEYRVLLLKSRGHFRAGFDEFVADSDVIEVATPGVTSPDLRRIAWSHRPRPVWPLDGDVAWDPECAAPVVAPGLPASAYPP